MTATQPTRSRPFRDTLWFIKRQREPRPIDESYVDDGSLSPQDSARFGVHTGATSKIPVFASGTGSQAPLHLDEPAAPESDPDVGACDDVDDDLSLELREIQRGRWAVLGMMAATAAVLGGAILLLF